MANRNAKLTPKMVERKWKKGQSGNPKGRPPRKTLESYVTDLLYQKTGPKGSERERIEVLALVIVDELVNRRNANFLKPILERLWPQATNVNVNGTVSTQALPPLSAKAAAELKARIEAERF